MIATHSVVDTDTLTGTYQALGVVDRTPSDTDYAPTLFFIEALAFSKCSEKKVFRRAVVSFDVLPFANGIDGAEREYSI